MTDNKDKSKKIRPKYDFWHYPKKWRNLSQKQFERLSEKQSSYMRIRNQENAKSDAAQKLVDDRQPIAKRHQPETNAQVAVKIIVTGVGAVMYVTVASIFASNLGKVRVPVSLIGGGILSFMVDKLATKAITNKAIKENAKATIQGIKEEKKNSAQGNDVFPLKMEYYDEKINVIEGIEDQFLQEKYPTNAVGAIALNTVEFGTAFWLMSNVTIFGGGIPFLVKPLVSSLPVLFTWGFAIYQKDAFELPKHYHEQMPVYQKYLFPKLDTPAQVLVNKEREDFLIDAEVNNILAYNPVHASPEIARRQADIEYSRNAIRQLEKSCNQEILERAKKLQKDIDSLPSQYTFDENKTKGLSINEIKQMKNKWEKEKQEWIKEETEKLQKNADYDMKAIKAAYDLEIKGWKEHIDNLQSNDDDNITA